ncbi:lipid kinase YegS [Halomonas sp. Bachu 37]|uniref:lipid kinase YegS n=1 Tax=Halomonas kashgarensis TaxID=3084920 RepID=UPI00321734AB
MRYLLIVNGKAAHEPELRDAVNAARKAGMPLDVQVTWEPGDAARFAKVAPSLGFTHVIAGGGDGTVNEVVNGLMALPHDRRPILGIVPLGSANDFATSIGLPLEASKALDAACTLMPQRVDAVEVINEHKATTPSYFLNVTTAGFGAEITANTPKLLKRALGGSAYSLMGVFKAWRHCSYRGRLCWEGGSQQEAIMLLAIANACQAGGGQLLAPEACIDDGLLDILIVKDFSSVRQLPPLLKELNAFARNGQYVDYFTTPWIEVSAESSEAPWPLTLDGEAREHAYFRAEVVPGALQLLMPESSSLLQRNKINDT